MQSAIDCKSTTQDQIRGPAYLRNLFLGLSENQNEINLQSLIIKKLTYLIPKLSSSSLNGFSAESRVAAETKCMLESSLRDTIALVSVRESVEQLQKSHVGLENNLSVAKKTIAEFEKKVVAYEEREANFVLADTAPATVDNGSNQTLIASLQDSLKKSKETEKRLIAENDALLETLDALESKERLQQVSTITILSAQEGLVKPISGPSHPAEAKIPYSRSVTKRIFNLNLLSTLPIMSDVSRNSIVQNPILSSRSLLRNYNPAGIGGAFVRVVTLGTTSSSIRK